jgi:hypothetical protein
MEMDLMNARKNENLLNNRSLALSAFPLVALVTALSGCGGAATNNLADPTANNGSKIVTCAASGATVCVTAQFVVDAPVVGLNYQCGIVNDITDSTGTVICPDQSVVTFSLQGKDRMRSITLGNYLVKSKRDTGRSATGSLVSITPLDLVSAATNATSLSDAIVKPAVNIAQLLETLRSSSSPFTADSPTSRLIIDDATKVKINLLAANVTAAQVSDGSFTTAIAPVLAGLGISLLPEDQTIARLSQALQAIQAGFYYTSPLFISGITDLSSATGANLATLATSATPDDQSVLGLSNLIDRSGHLIGQGAEWNGNISPVNSSMGTKTAYNLLTGPNGYTRLLPVNDSSFINPVSGFVLSNYTWQPRAYALNSQNVWTESATPTPLGQAKFSNGRLLGGTYIVGNQTLWQNVNNQPATVLAPANELASWKQDNNPTANYYSGSLTLQKSRSVDTFLDPSVFKTAANVGSGNKAIFPLYAVLTFSYVDGNKSTQEIGKQGIAILANGNIVTDMKQDCNAIPATQYPIGLVGAAFQGVTQISDRFISPIIMLSGTQFGALDGIQMGTTGFSRSAKINVVGATSGSINITDNTNVTSTDSQGNTTLVSTGEQSNAPATYTNFYDFWSLLKNTYTTNKQTPSDIAVALRSVGKVTIALNTSCYVPPVGN